MSKEEGIIYKAQNVLNHKIYIGCSSQGIDKRKWDHINNSNNNSQSYFHQEIKTYGEEAFIWDIIDTGASRNELAQKEKEYIIKYNSKEEGYNSDAGGGFKKTVYQYDLDSGKILNSFETLEEAGASVGASRKSINNVCLGANKTCKGFYWSYIQEEPFGWSVDTRKKKVIQLDLNNVPMAEYESVGDWSIVSESTKKIYELIRKKVAISKN